MSLLQKSIVNRIKRGNILAFEKVFRELYSPLCGYANKMINDQDKAEEIVQEVFYIIWKNKERLTIRVSLKSYLYKSVQNSCLQIGQHQLVKDKYRQFVINRDNDKQQSPETVLEVKEINKAIDQTLDALPERCKEIFYMNRFEGLKYREIAEKLSVSQKTVEANISKALKHLRKNLKQYVDVI
ncbi:MAG: RNA polymerase sigma-70 factor [Bacteroidetes bacterium]|nr:MAG: RNA polymerase sigma-70 factor [Bacteroidota bacterium]